MDQLAAKEFTMLKTSINDYKIENTQAIAELMRENENMKKEILSTNSIKDEIQSDFVKIKERLNSQESLIDCKEDENRKMKEELISLKDMLSTSQTESNALASEQSMFNDELYKSLKGICQKYESVNYISEQMKIKFPTNSDENKVQC